MKSINTYIAISGFVFFFLSCATVSKSDYLDLDDAVFSGRYEHALSEMNKTRQTLYPERNTIMYLFDKGMLEHYAGRYKDSSSSLEEADRLMEEAYTKDFSDNFSSYLSRDAGKRSYNGEDFENIYSNLFGALNYYQLGDTENALVEIRRMNEKLVYLSTEYASQKTKILERFKDWIAGSELDLTNSAFARYLGMLLYRAEGKFDDARIEAEEIAKAFADAPEVYNHAMPSSLVFNENGCEELAVPAGKARLNILGFLGLTPYKVVENNGYEAAVREYIMGEGNIGIEYELDKMGSNSHLNLAIKERSSQVNKIEVIFDDGKRFTLEMLEDIGRITSEMIKRRQARLETLANMKFLLTVIPGAVTGVYAGMGKGLTFVFMGLSRKAQFRMLADMLKKETMQYDARMSRFFPDKALAGGITLDPGTYSFSVNYYIDDTLLKSNRYEHIAVKADKLNLIETFHLSDEDSDSGAGRRGLNINGFPKNGKYTIFVCSKGGNDREDYLKYAAAYGEASLSGGKNSGKITMIDTKTWSRWTGSGQYYVYFEGGFLTTVSPGKPINFTNGAAEINLAQDEWSVY
jgi:tetratricopeptide (TPR) repeat protein